MPTVNDLLGTFQKDYGAAVGSKGAQMQDAERLPTGIFPFDLATGGGFPRGKVAIVYGPESSNKTNLCLKAIAMHQALWPDQKCVFVDIENSFDPQWAALMGVDVDELIVIWPDYAEQTVDMVEAFLCADDVGMVVIDSLAAMVTTQELDNSAEKANVGGSALVTGKLVRKTTHALNLARKAGRLPTLIYINQTRFKIGVMYGNPETMPGGNAPKFQSGLTIRTYGKNISDPKVIKDRPILKETKIQITKSKCPIYADSAEFRLVVHPHKGLQVGETDDWNSVSAWMKDMGMLDKAPGGWTMLGEKYPNLEACRQRLVGDPAFGTKVRQTIIDTALKQGGQG